MARQLRFQYPGAVYHVMARGDGGKQLFLGKEDHESFRHWLEQVCGEWDRSPVRQLEARESPWRAVGRDREHGGFPGE